MIKGHSIAGTSTKRERIEDDYYATPPSATQVFLESFGLNNCKTFLEPACGEGHISKEIEKYFTSLGYSIGTEIEIDSTDLVYRGYGKGNVDFLDLHEKFKYDCIITNPPFKLAKEFILKALKLSNKYVIMFAKIQLLEGLGRKELFEKNPPKYIYVFRNRVNPLRNGNPLDENGKPWASTMCFAWFVWEIGFEGEPTIRWLQTKRGVSELKLGKAQSFNTGLEVQKSKISSPKLKSEILTSPNPNFCEKCDSPEKVKELTKQQEDFILMRENE